MVLTRELKHATFLSDAREPEVHFLQSRAGILNKFLGKSSLIRVKTLDNKNLLASRFIKRQKGSLPVVVRRSKTSLLKLAIDTQAYFQKLKSHDFICKILRNNVFH